jgi:hypothetical protein
MLGVIRDLKSPLMPSGGRRHGGWGDVVRELGTFLGLL